ncbi:MAG: hypothetical protein AAF434_05090 [Pseudomonadota bacterium]
MDTLPGSLSATHWIIAVLVVFVLVAFTIHFKRLRASKSTEKPQNSTQKTKDQKREERKANISENSAEIDEDLLSTYPPFNRRGGGVRVVKHERRKNHTLFDETEPHTAAILGALSALSGLVDKLAKERRKELTERNNERFSIALDYLIDFEQLLERDPIPNLLEISAPQEEEEKPEIPAALIELSNRKVDPEMLQHEFLKLSQSMLPLIKQQTPPISMLTVIERLNSTLRDSESQTDEPENNETEKQKKERLPRYAESDDSVFL